MKIDSPLSWPPESRRAKWRGPAQFRHQGNPLSVEEALNRLEHELELLIGRISAAQATVSMNLGSRSDRTVPKDPGVVVRFELNRRQTVLPCDQYDTVAANIASIAAHIDATRAIQRHGVGTLEQVLRGYQALEDQSEGTPWRRVLGFKDGAAVTLEEANRNYREKVKIYHTDVAGGDHRQTAQLNLAIEQARKELGKDLKKRKQRSYSA